MSRSQFSFRVPFPALLPCVTIVLLASAAEAGVQYKVLHRFAGKADGAYPSSSLIMDSSGNLYGATSDGGSTANCKLGCGVVFELSPSNDQWQEKVLYTFKGETDGLEPSGNLVFDSSGNLYGTTYGGGTGTNCTPYEGCGTVFQLAPTASGPWKKTILYNFQDEGDGALPVGLTIDGKGNLFGVNITGSKPAGAEFGVVFEVSPPTRTGGKWKEQSVYNFQAFEVNGNPGLIFDAHGNLFGTWFQEFQCQPDGCGVAFELENTKNGYEEEDLFDFHGGGDGGEPMAGLILDGKGNLYGTGNAGGNNQGIAFELINSNGQWSENILHSFCSQNNCDDGADPLASLVFDATGNLYGTTSAGGSGCSFDFSCGVVFRLRPTAYGWDETVLHAFKGEPDGSNPEQGLIPNGNGGFYGTTARGGTGANGGYGTVFEITP
ncbi:MAG TPA: choice-of-anchor tandem repeat GloVer-containing protein [Terriglobales bacterium]